MAQNLESSITEGQATISGMPNPWQIQMHFYGMVDRGDGTLVRQEVRSWSVDAPSELVAKEIKAALDGLTNDEYDLVYGQVAVH